MKEKRINSGFTQEKSPGGRGGGVGGSTGPVEESLKEPRGSTSRKGIEHEKTKKNPQWSLKW